MKAHTASFINAILLIAFGLWAYIGSETPSLTTLIPVTGGIILLFLYPGTKREDKIIAHITVTITLLIFIGLFKPLFGAIERNDTLALVRVITLLLSGILAIASFIKSFRDARRNRENS